MRSGTGRVDQCRLFLHVLQVRHGKRYSHHEEHEVIEVLRRNISPESSFIHVIQLSRQKSSSFAYFMSFVVKFFFGPGGIVIDVSGGAV